MITSSSFCDLIFPSPLLLLRLALVGIGRGRQLLPIFEFAQPLDVLETLQLLFFEHRYVHVVLVLVLRLVQGVRDLDEAHSQLVDP